MNDKPVVVHIIYHLGIGGMEQVLVDTVGSLSDDFVHVVVVLTQADIEYRTLLNDHIRVIELQMRFGNDLTLWPRIFRILREPGVQVCHTYNISTIEYQMAAFVARVPLRVHAEHGRDASDPDGSHRKYLMLRQFMRFFVHRWIAVSEDLETWLLETVRARHTKVTLVRNGVNTQQFKPFSEEPTSATAAFPEPLKSADGLVVGTVGRLDAVKNQHLLLEAVARANRETSVNTPGFKLVIIGDGPMLESLRSRADELGSDVPTWFSGARHDVHDLLPLLDIFVLSSDAEGIPIALLEAMACGVPVVVSRVGGMPEVVNERCGVLFAPQDVRALTDALLAIAKQPAAAAERARLARLRVQSDFSREKMVDTYRQVYRGELQN